MKKQRAVLLEFGAVLVLAAGCGPAVETEDPAWLTAPRPESASAAAGPSGDVADICASEGFWAKPGTRGDPRVLEFSSEGTILRRWPKPRLYPVAAVAGERIVIVLSPVPEPGVVAVFIASDGSCESPYIAYPGGGRSIPCPPLTAFASRSSWRCFEYSDLESGEKRFLGYEDLRP